MSCSDPVADMLTKIRNAVSAKKEKVCVPCSNFKIELVKILKNEGYIINFKKITRKNLPVIQIFLKYNEDRSPVIHGIKSESTAGRRFYIDYKSMPQVLDGFGTLVVSTSKGVLTGRKAKAEKVGGEIICRVW